MSQYHFIEPLDVLFLRGNKLFGDPGSYGEAHLPPWPSVAAGAIRSMLLACDCFDFERFSQGRLRHPALGTPSEPGAFRLTDFSLARRNGNGAESVRALPADLVVARDNEGNLSVFRMKPGPLHPGILCSFPLPQLPVLAERRRRKPVAGYWLGEAGWLEYLRGGTPRSDQLIETGQLWRMDERVGVGLDPARRRTDDGKLFSTQAVAFLGDVGFLVGSTGADLPENDLLRFGGDGRGATFVRTAYQPPMVDPARLVEARRCRIVLTTPGVFGQGWRLPGMAEDGMFDLYGVKGRIVAAAVSRAEVVSGWDLARWQPKTALRAVPTGSVYWLDELEATAAGLDRLAGHGLWLEEGYDAQRRLEGFNRFVFAEWG